MRYFYDHKQIEPKWQQYWESEKLFAARDNGISEKKYILDMFPYPSSAGLHVGHPEGYTATDIISRFERMRGNNVLHPMGWDAFGLPAENFAIKQGVHPRDTTGKNIENFRRQIKSLGFSYDWSREVNTADPLYYKWTQWLFLELYNHGLAYKKKAPVNWCESCQTVLAREQVIDGKCERCKNEIMQKELSQWFFKITEYADRLLEDIEQLDWPDPIKLMQRNWIGRSEGALIEFEIRISEVEANSKQCAVSEFEKVIFATSNPAKVKRVKKLLSKIGIHIEILTPLEAGIEAVEVEENGLLDENAESKARAYAGKTKAPVLALDSGLFIDDEDVDPVRVRRKALSSLDESSLSQSEIAEKLIDYYRAIARKHGGEVEGYWLDSWCLILPDGTVNKSESRRDIILTDKEVGNKDKYVPIRCLYKVKQTGKYTDEQSEDEYYFVEMKSLLESLRVLFASKLSVFTTRPDTLFGATYIVLAPEHELVSKLKTQSSNFKAIEDYIQKAKKKSELERVDLAKEKTGVEIKGVKAVNPATGEEIPIWVADYVLTGYGTGAIMAVPAHDERDFAFAKKYNLPIREVVSGGDISVEAYIGEGSAVNSGEFDGLDTNEFKKKIVEWLEEKGTGKRAVNYRLRDWLVSRQRYWGAPIPVIYCRKCWDNRQQEGFEIDGEQYAIVPVPEKDLPVLLPDDVDFRPHGESPLARSKSFHEVACPRCGATGDGVRRESDTMDTFVDSSWYFLRYTDPRNDSEFASQEALADWCPVDLYVGGAEHAVLHLLYARFITKALKDFGYVNFDEPFLKLRNQGMILSEDGRKMSKSLGNVINPDEVVDEYGADTMRLYEMFMGPLEDTKPWSTKGIIGVRRFLEKVWLIINENAVAENFQPSREFTVPQDKSSLTRLAHQTIKKVTEDIENFKFNTAISQLMIFTNALEKTTNVKRQTSNGNESDNGSSVVNRKLFVDCCKLLVVLLSPLAPHIAEELWEILGQKPSVSQQTWPTYDPTLAKADTIELVLQVNGKVRDRVKVSAGVSEEEAKEYALKSEKIRKYLNKKIPRKIIFVKGKLVNIVV